MDVVFFASLGVLVVACGLLLVVLWVFSRQHARTLEHLERSQVHAVELRRLLALHSQRLDALLRAPAFEKSGTRPAQPLRLADLPTRESEMGEGERLALAERRLAALDGIARRDKVSPSPDPGPKEPELTSWRDVRALGEAQRAARAAMEEQE